MISHGRDSFVDVRGKFVYEGDACRVDGNCMENARCNGPENRCRCLPDYVSTNGLCCKYIRGSFLRMTQ